MSHVTELKEEINNIYEALSKTNDEYYSSISKMKESLEITNKKINSVLIKLRENIYHVNDMDLINKINPSYQADYLINKIETNENIKDIDYKEKRVIELHERKKSLDKEKRINLNSEIGLHDLIKSTELNIVELNTNLKDVGYKIKNLEIKVNKYDVNSVIFDSYRINLKEEDSAKIFQEYKANQSSIVYRLSSLFRLEPKSGITREQTKYFSSLEKILNKDITEIYKDYIKNVEDIKTERDKYTNLTSIIKNKGDVLDVQKESLRKNVLNYEYLKRDYETVINNIEELTNNLTTYGQASKNVDEFVLNKTKKDSLKKLTINNVFDFKMTYKELEMLKKLNQMSLLLNQDILNTERKLNDSISMLSNLSKDKSKIDKLKDYSRVNDKIKEKLGSSLTEFKNNNKEFVKQLKDDVSNVKNRTNEAINNNYTVQSITNYNLLFLAVHDMDNKVNLFSTTDVLNNVNSNYSTMSESFSNISDSVSSISDTASSVSCSSSSPSSSCSSSSSSSCSSGGCGGS